MNRELWSAVAIGDIPRARKAWELGANVACVLKSLGPHTRDKDNRSEKTPLHLAAQRGDTPMVRALIGMGADPDVVDHEDKTPLHKAASTGRLGAANALIKLGADVNAKTEHQFDETPLHIAVRKKFTSLVKVLLDSGADVNATTYALETPLHVAAQEGHILMARMLLIAGVNLRARAENGWTAMVAAQFAEHNKCFTYLSKVHAGRIDVKRMQRREGRSMLNRSERDARRRKRTMADGDRGSTEQGELSGRKGAGSGRGVKRQRSDSEED